MATHSSILVQSIPRTQEPGGATVHGVAESDYKSAANTLFHFCPVMTAPPPRPASFPRICHNLLVGASKETSFA